MTYSCPAADVLPVAATQKHADANVNTKRESVFFIRPDDSYGWATARRMARDKVTQEDRLEGGIVKADLAMYCSKV